MTSSEIRNSFFDFFASREHTLVPSASLLPTAPNLLFTNAGMNPFVPYFLGERQAPEPRVVNTQKCIRAGGKHNDLEDVGFDSYHHTFFEMLGNWSFGDYFKKEAIQWAWELLTVEWKFPKHRLYATVYKPDDGDPASFDEEAYRYWEEIFLREGLDPAIHIVFGNQKDNFWMMGETGPCGPCSEIHVDLTPAGDSLGKLVNQDSAECMEIWNLVFIQFNATANGAFTPLASRHVDTGMGLERVAGILASTRNFTDFSRPPSNYACDLFTPIFEKIAELSGESYKGSFPSSRDHMSRQESVDCSFRVLADHIRTLTCSIADGILPGNEGRNYVLRRILRRAVHFGRRLNLAPGFFAGLIDPVIRQLGDVFPEIRERQKVIRKVIQAEEEAFGRTLDRGLQLFNKIVEKNPKTLSGEDAFSLYDTYGFPLDLTQILAREQGLSVDLAGFEKSMKAQRERARAAQQKTEITVSGDADSENETPFFGYDTHGEKPFTVTVVDVVRDRADTYLVFDRTPFYAEMGGQVGDTGITEVDGLRLRIDDTRKDKAGRFLHKIGSPLPGSSGEEKEETEFLRSLGGREASVCVDFNRRRAIERHHSATHLIHHALREILGPHVNQAGSLVDAEHLRFDFSHYEALSEEQRRKIEDQVNERIMEDAPVSWKEVEFDKKGDDVIAFFGEKYGAIVRVVDIGGFSKELCGGTHVQATGQIGPVKIVTESAIAAGTRRMEAVAGKPALAFIKTNLEALTQTSSILSVPPPEVKNSVERLLEKNNRLEKELQKFQQKEAAQLAEKLASSADESGALRRVVARVDVSSADELRSLGAQILGKLGEGYVVLGAPFDGKVTLVALASPEAIRNGIRAGDIIRELAGALGGKGGGKPDFAMGGGKKPEKLESVFDSWKNEKVSP